MFVPAFGDFVGPWNPGKSESVRLDFVVRRWIDSNSGQTAWLVIPLQYFGITFHESGSIYFRRPQPSTSCNCV